MFKTAIVNTQSVFVLIASILVTACGGGGDSGSNRQGVSESRPEVFIAGGGIKGPLAFASVELYVLDTRFEQLYEPGNPIAAATTNAYAEITGLAVPRDIAPPFVLVIDGTNAIDRNTDLPPVISKLVTVITKSALDAGQPVYATPYTTLAYEMLKLESKATGLHATYFNDLALSSVALERVDPEINFSWQRRSPDSSVNANRFSVRWSGLIEADYSEKYSFYTSTDDGVRLWVDDKLIVDHWADQPETEHFGTISFRAGRKYPIVMEYYDNGGEAVATLAWSSASQPKTIVPKEKLYSLASNAVRGVDTQLSRRLSDVNTAIIRGIGFGMSPETNIFTTPPIITDTTRSLAQQELVVEYRAAVEALSAILYEISLSSDSGVSPDELLAQLALDLTGDGVIDGTDSGQPIGEIDFEILGGDPMSLTIPNSKYLVGDIVALMEEERALLGDSGNVLFLTDDIIVDLRSTSNSTATGVSRLTLDRTGLDGNKVKGALLHVDFDDHPGGGYTEQDAIADFRADQSKGKGWSHHTKDTDVVADPTGDPARGKVMRVTHLAGQGGGGPRFKARIPSADEYYLAFDVFIPKSNELVMIEKLPGLMYGSLLDASHAGGVTPVPEGVKAFSVMHQLIEPRIYESKGPVNQLTSYIYDADRVQYNTWFNVVDPDDSPSQSTWNFPKGQWVRIEQRIKQNTATVHNGRGDLSDGILQQWVNGQLAVDRQDMHWRTKNSMHIDGIFMYNNYGGGASDPRNWPSKTQYTYFDNFIVSTSPITH